MKHRATGNFLLLCDTVYKECNCDLSILIGDTPHEKTHIYFSEFLNDIDLL